MFQVGVVLLLLGTSLGGSQFEWNSAPIIVFFVLGGIILVISQDILLIIQICFVVVEFKVKEPVIEMRVFKIRNVWLADLLAGISYCRHY